jgi:hypothetical protein
MQNQTGYPRFQRRFDRDTLRYTTEYVNNDTDPPRRQPRVFSNVQEFLDRGDADSRGARILSDFSVLHWPQEFLTWEQREWPQGYNWVWRHVRDHGVRVHCEVAWLVQLDGNTEHQLLAIKVKPLRDQWFPLRMPPNPWHPWHVSICFREDKDAQGNRIWTSTDIAHLIRKFDQATHHLVLNQEHWHPTGSVLELDPRQDPIASDEVVERLHREGHYGNRNIHISM